MLGSFADMAELVDAPGLGPGELACGGSSPSIRTQNYATQVLREIL
jgi:hypothetical protein